MFLRLFHVPPHCWLSEKAKKFQEERVCESETHRELAEVKMVWSEGWGSLAGGEKGPGAKTRADVHPRGQKQAVLSHACPHQCGYEDDGDEEKEALTIWERSLG